MVYHPLPSCLPAEALQILKYPYVHGDKWKDEQEIHFHINSAHMLQGNLGKSVLIWTALFGQGWNFPLVSCTCLKSFRFEVFERGKIDTQIHIKQNPEELDFSNDNCCVISQRW
jgi:predicted cupin superfamily sugar epimerase